MLVVCVLQSKQEKNTTTEHKRDNKKYIGRIRKNGTDDEGCLKGYIEQVHMCIYRHMLAHIHKQPIHNYSVGITSLNQGVKQESNEVKHPESMDSISCFVSLSF